MNSFDRFLGRNLRPPFQLLEQQTQLQPYTFQPFKYEKIESSNSKEVPAPRSGHRIVCNDSCVYVYGGYTPHHVDSIDEPHLVRQHLFNELWQFNLSNRKWTLLPGQETIPEELASVAVLFDGKTLMIYGGTGLPFGWSSSNRMYYWTLTKEEFFHGVRQRKATGVRPPPLYGQALLYFDGYIYTIGGTTGIDFTCDIHGLNLSTDEWEEVYIDTGSSEHKPEPRYRHEIAFDGQHIYIFGGGTNECAGNLEFIPTFNLKTRTWKSIHTKRDISKINELGYPEPRLCHSLVQYTDPNTKDTYVYILGGNDGPDTAFNSLWRLQLSDFSWQHLVNCDYPYPVFFHSSCITRAGKMLTFGGINKGNRSRRTNFLFGMWLRIPKLSEICWEAVCHYSGGKMSEMSQKQLLNIGVPKHFVDRFHNYL